MLEAFPLLLFYHLQRLQARRFYVALQVSLEYLAQLVWWYSFKLSAHVSVEGYELVCVLVTPLYLARGNIELWVLVNRVEYFSWKCLENRSGGTRARTGDTTDFQWRVPCSQLFLAVKKLPANQLNLP